MHTRGPDPGVSHHPVGNRPRTSQETLFTAGSAIPAANYRSGENRGPQRVGAPRSHAAEGNPFPGDGPSVPSVPHGRYVRRTYRPATHLCPQTIRLRGKARRSDGPHHLGQVPFHHRSGNLPPIGNLNPLLVGPASHHRRCHRCGRGGTCCDRALSQRCWGRCGLTSTTSGWCRVRLLGVAARNG